MEPEAYVVWIGGLLVIVIPPLAFWLCWREANGGQGRPRRRSTVPVTSPSEEALRRHEGDLLKITQGPDVDVIAWQLFSKHGVSNAVLQTVINPATPPKPRISLLLSAVRDRVANEPAVLDTFIDVLKREPSFKNTAQKLQVTYNKLTSQGNFEVTGKDDDLPTYSGTQSSAPKKASPVEVYASFLRSVYLRQKFPTYGKLPTSPSKKYTNLASVKKERVSKERANAFTRATLRGGIDDVAKEKAPITMKEIGVVRRGVWPRCILVEGAPGIGKSTFAWKMCRQWGKKKILCDYKLVVLLSLREKKVRDATCVSDLFNFFDAEIQQQVVKEVTKSGGKGVLLLLEGYDELPTELRKRNSLFLDIIRGKVLSQATVLITSRPSASGFLYEECQDYLSQHIEILGFTSENVQSYLKSTCDSDSTLLEGIQKYLECYPHIRTMMYVPLNAAIVVEVYRASKRDQSHVPQTMTQLYDCLIRTQLRRYLNAHPVHGKPSWTLRGILSWPYNCLVQSLFRRNNHHPVDVKRKWKVQNFDDLPPDVLKHFCALAKIAYDGIKNGQQLIFNDLPEDFDTLGLMQCVPELYVDKGAAVSHSFLHLTIQEFMAAFHLWCHPTDRQFETTESEYQMVVRFLAGLTSDVQALAGSESEKATFTIDTLHMIFEAQRDTPVDTTTRTIAFCHNHQATIFDCYVLGYCITHSNSTWNIDLKQCFLGDDGIDGLVQGIQEHLLETQGGIGGLTLSGNFITAEGMRHLLKLPPHRLASKLEQLDISSNPVSSEGVEVINSLMQRTARLQKLNMRGIHISLENCKVLSSFLRTSKTLTHLVLRNCEIGPAAATHLADALRDNRALQELHMFMNPLGVGGATKLADALKTNKALKKLNLNDKSIGEAGTRRLLNALKVNTSLTLLQLPSKFKDIVNFRGVRNRTEWRSW